ncbi:hypothetical protein Pth03_30200 [Planotetraspora thailandica]|uniref:Uncharacterized protein n=1 Tax=Planotetraspora thailandica TaxID=487172 RepID=A0A8J3V427_9ACTN|nr:hypothetical protein Pth03_30200 [Planotetraspora thailandica]
MPSFGEVFFDARGQDRVLRVTWHEGTLVLSLWRGEMCTGSFRMPMDAVERLIDTLDEGFAEAGGQYTDDNGQDPGTGPMQRQDGGYPQQSDYPAHPGEYPGTGQYSRPAPAQPYPEQQQYPDQQYADQQYADQQYPDQQYADQQYADQHYGDQHYPDPQYADPQYADQQHYQDQYPGQAAPPQHPAGANDVLVARGAPPREVPRERPFTGGPVRQGPPGYPAQQQPGTVDPSDPLGLGQGGRPYPQQDYQQDYPPDPMYTTDERMRPDQRPEPGDDQRVW